MGLKREAWRKVFEQTNLSFENGLSRKIEAKEIKALTGGKEPRLVTSMDSREQVPGVLGEKGLFVLPVKNGVYQLVQGEGFQDIEDIPGSPKSHESSLSFDLTTVDGRGEDRYIQYSFNTGLLSRFTGINDLFQTSMGRKYCDPFSFNVGESGPVDVESVQFQVDGLFEGKKDIVILEAKVGSRSSFLVRQLYYPYRHYSKDSDKGIKTFFFIYDDHESTYNFWEYDFENSKDYESINLKKREKYEIVEKEPDLEEFQQVERRSDLGWNPPQADSVEKIQEFPFAIRKGYDNYEKLSEYFGFTERQSSYYRQAMERLGLVETKNHKYVLTSLGENYVSSRPDERNEFLAKQMLQVPVLNEVFHELVDKYLKGLGKKDASLDRRDIASIMKENTKLSGSTSRRRSRTVLSWFQWISEHVGIVTVRGGKIRLRIK